MRYGECIGWDIALPPVDYESLVIDVDDATIGMHNDIMVAVDPAAISMLQQI